MSPTFSFSRLLVPPRSSTRESSPRNEMGCMAFAGTQRSARRRGSRGLPPRCSRSTRPLAAGERRRHQRQRARCSRTRRCTRRGLVPSQRKAADACARYLRNNRDWLDYASALRRGFPISAGVQKSPISERIARKPLEDKSSDSHQIWWIRFRSFGSGGKASTHPDSVVGESRLGRATSDNGRLT